MTTTAPPPRRTPTVLDRRRLNRALLDRQMLLRRRRRSPRAVVERLVGLQGQAPLAPYTGLWSRIEGFRPEQLARLLEDREVVRLVAMRGTVHLMTADDALALRPLVQPLLDRDLDTNTAHAPDLRGIDRSELAAAARALYEQRPRTNPEIGAALAERYPGRAPSALAHAARGLLALVQVPPRGVWGAGGQVRCTTAEAWIGRPLAAAPRIEDMVRRYLGAFGPASVADVQTWSGLRGLGEVVERLGRARAAGSGEPGLRVFRDEDGRELFDLPRAPRPAADTPAPVRLLAEFDNVLLSHADRRRIESDEHRRTRWTVNGQIPGAVLVDGFVRGTWRLDRDRKAATAVVTVQLLAPTGPADEAAITAEAARLAAFAAPDRTHDVRITGPT
jgi:hypothetical protein